MGAADPPGSTARAEPWDVPALWRSYAAHAERLFASGPAPRRVDGHGWILVTTGSPRVDTNQLMFHAPAGPADVAAAVAAREALGVPVLTGLSSSLLDRPGIARTLAAAGFAATAATEVLFAARTTPPVDASWPVRQATPADLGALREVFQVARGYGPEVVDPLFGSLLGKPDIGCWIAWDGTSPMSLAFVTRIGSSLALWDMLTVPAHRRRGAGSAVLTTAFSEAARWSDVPIDEIVFWSSPLGRPLYERLGFAAADEVQAMTFGASAADLAAVGAG